MVIGHFPICHKSTFLHTDWKSEWWFRGLPIENPNVRACFHRSFLRRIKTDKVLNPACTEPQEGNWAPGYLQKKWFQLRTCNSQSTPSTHPRIITRLSPAMTKSPRPFWFSSPVSSRYLSRITSENPITGYSSGVCQQENRLRGVGSRIQS